MSQLPPLTLRGSVFAFVSLCLLIVSAALGVFIYLKAERLTDEVLDYTARFRTTAAVEDLAHSLEHDWTHLAYLADQVSRLDRNALTQHMNGVAADGDRIAWIGFADLGGTVVAATGDRRVGQDVSARPWFRGGLNGGFASDVREAVLLAREVGTDEPLRVIDFARPVQNAHGDLLGVIGMHINAIWLTEHLRVASARYGIDLFLVDAKGEVAASSTRETPTAAALQILRAAQVGTLAEGREVWPDGQSYFSFLVPQVSTGELPNLGWRVVGRLDAQASSLGPHLLFNGAHYVLLAAFLSVGLLTALYTRLITAPFAALAATAERIAEGSQEYPMEAGLTREVAQLASALTRLQLSSAFEAAPRHSGPRKGVTVMRSGLADLRLSASAANSSWPVGADRPLAGSVLARVHGLAAAEAV